MSHGTVCEYCESLPCRCTYLDLQQQRIHALQHDKTFWREYADETCKNLSESNAKLVAELAEMTKERDEALKVTDMLNEWVAQRDQTIRDQQETWQNLADEAARLRTERAEARLELAQLTLTLNEKERKIQELEAELNRSARAGLL